MKNNVIVDLDGTLALDAHRAIHLQSTPRDWDTYFSLCPGDHPNSGIIELVNILSEDGYMIHIISGRTDKYIRETEVWLNRHCVSYDTLNLRPAASRVQDTELKLEIAKRINLSPRNVLCVFEDRTRVVASWRAAGYTCLQVAQGDF